MPMKITKKIVAVVQARMGSTRLPGKSMMDLGGRPLLENVLRRVAAARTIDATVLATSDLPGDAVLPEVAHRLGLHSLRGSESDVLSRFIQAGRQHEADVVVRICADNPLVDPGEIDRAVTTHLESDADYTFNHIPAMGNDYPDGFGAEVVNFPILEEIAERSGAPRHREHVTVYIWDNPDGYNIQTVHAPAAIAAPDVKLDIDTPEDMERMRKLFAQAPDLIETWCAHDIVRAYRDLFRKAVGR